MSPSRRGFDLFRVECLWSFLGVRVTDEAIRNSLSVAPKQESILFDNRDKFDLVAICDEFSTIPDSPAIENLMKAI